MDFFDTLFSFIKPKEINEYEVSNPPSKICTEDEESFKEQVEEKPTVEEDDKLADVGEKSGNHPSIRNWSKSGKFKCNECEYSSHRKQLLKFHYEAVHLGIRKFFCRHCDYKCYMKSSMKHHMKSKHDDDGRILKLGCEKCTSMEEHICAEPHIGLGKYKCNECDKGFRNMGLLQYHTESSHLGIKRFFCRNCSYACYGHSTMRYHMKFKHNDNGKILRIGCEKCETMEKHKYCEKQKSQTVLGKFKCIKCQYSSSRKRALKVHSEVVHLKISRFFADIVITSVIGKKI